MLQLPRALIIVIVVIINTIITIVLVNEFQTAAAEREKQFLA